MNMKNLFLCILFGLINHTIFSQTNPEFSEAFKEPEGWTKLVQIRNGNTALVEVTKRKGINFTLYGADHKLISSKKLLLTKVGDKLGGPSSVPAIYDIGGNVSLFVLFFMDGEKWLIPTLIRVTVDGKTGDVIEEVIVQQLKEFNMDDNMELAYGERGYPDITVEKDPNSDYYAVIGNNQYVKNINQVLSIMHFSPEHQKINNAFIQIPDQKFKYVNYLGAFVKKDEYVMVGACAYNNGKSGKESRFFLSKLEKGSADIKQQDLKYNDHYEGAKCSFIYNKVKNNVTMILTTIAGFTDDEDVYDIVFQTINPATMQVDTYYKGDLTKMNDYYKNKMNSRKDFSCFIGGTSIAPDGNLIVLYQNIQRRLLNPSSAINMNKTSTNNSMFDPNGATGVPRRKWTVNESYLGDVGLTVISSEGKVNDAFAINYAMRRSGDLEDFGYDNARNGKKSRFGMQDPGLGAPWYFSLDFIATENANYIFCNAESSNFEKIETERHDRTKAITLTNAVKYTYKNGTLKKEYLFGAPLDKKANKFCNFTSSSYNPQTKTYCTIMTDTKEKKNYIAWFKLD